MPFSQSTIISHRPLEYIYTDVWSSPIFSLENFKYYILFIDHFTRYTWLFPFKQKYDVKQTLINFKSLVENRFQARISTLFSDNGGEYIALCGFLATNGISHLTSLPHTPEHNGLSERKHRHIVETRDWPNTLIYGLHSNNILAIRFCYIDIPNKRMPTPVLNNTSPYKKLFNQSPNYDKLRVFGCLCFPWLRPYTNNKLEVRSLPCVFMGYSPTQSAYICLHVPSTRLYISCHVQFQETRFPFREASLSRIHNDNDENMA